MAEYSQSQHKNSHNMMDPTKKWIQRICIADPDQLIHEAKLID